MTTKTPLIVSQLELLAHTGYTELRIPKKGVQVFDTAANVAVISNNYINGDCYIGINPRANKGGLSKDVGYLTCLVYDFDPVRPKDTPSTEEQHSDAIAVARRFHTDNPGSVLVDSGSGAHVYIPVEPIKITDDNRANVTSYLQKLTQETKTKYATQTVRCDSIFDLSRIIRVWGSHNEKSNRLCHPISGLDNYSRKTLVIPVNTQATGATVGVQSDYLQRFEKLAKLNPEIQGIMLGTAKFPSRNEADFKLTKFLIEAKFTDPEILSIRQRSVLSKSDDRSDDWILSDIQRCREKLGCDGRVVRIDSNYLKTLAERKPGIATGLTILDDKMGGLRNGHIIVLAGLPTTGKTTLVTQVGVHIARTGKKVLFFPTESNSTAIHDKVLSAACQVNLKKFQMGNFLPDELKKIETEAKKLGDLPLYVMNEFGLTVDTVEKKIVELAPDVVIIDYLQGMSYVNGGDALELGKAVIDFKRMGQQYNVPIIILSQLNTTEEVKLESLYGTKKLGQQADYVIIMQTMDPFSYPRPVNAYVVKAKYGEPGIVKLKFESSICKFTEQEKQ